MVASSNLKNISKGKQTSKHTKIRLPSYHSMVLDAVKSLPRSNKGYSRFAVYHYILDNYKPSGSHVRVNNAVTLAIKKMIASKQLVVVSGIGAAGKFKIPSVTGSELSSSSTIKKKKKPNVKRILNLEPDYSPQGLSKGLKLQKKTKSSVITKKNTKRINKIKKPTLSKKSKAKVTKNVTAKINSLKKISSTVTNKNSKKSLKTKKPLKKVGMK